MTKAQRLELRASEIRQRLNELSGIETGEITEEQRGELDALSVEYADVERQRRAAILAGDSPEMPEPEPQGSEQREIDALIERAEIGAYLRAAAGENHVDGAERELRHAILGDDAPEMYMPVDMLMPLETRADASTDVAASIQHNQRNIIGRIFSETAGAYLGVQRPSVPIGDSHYYHLTGGTTADVRSDGVAIEAGAATFTEKSVSPVRATSRYLFGVETTARIRGFEEALRADIRAVLGDKLDYMAINGQAAVENVSPAIEGIISQLTAPTNPTDTATWDSYLRLYFEQVDGKVSMDGSNVRLLVNPDTYKHASLGACLRIDRRRCQVKENRPRRPSGPIAAIQTRVAFPIAPC